MDKIAENNRRCLLLWIDCRKIDLKIWTLIRTALFCALSSYSVHASAGLFGPQTYNECVLEKMKGQDRGLIGTARAACAEQFPQELTLVKGEHYAEGEIQYEWCETESDSVSVCLSKNETVYKITKIVLYMQKAKCEENSDKYVKATALPAMYGLYGNKYKAKTENSKSFQCMHAQFIGVKK